MTQNTFWNAGDVRLVVKPSDSQTTPFELKWPAALPAAGSVLTFSDALGTMTGAAGVATAGLDATTIQYANVALTKTQILGLNATPVEVVPAPGAGKFIEFVSGMISVTFATAAYANGGAVAFYYAGQSAISATVSAANSFLNAASQIWTVLPSGNGGGARATYLNLGITISNATGAFTDPGTAAGTARVAVAYRVHSLV